MKFALLVVFLFLAPLALANNFTSQNTAEIDLKIRSQVETTATGSSPRLLGAEAILYLIPLETDTQEILELSTYSDPEAKVEKQASKITYSWGAIPESEINYGLNSLVKTKNAPLRIRERIQIIPSTEKYSEQEKYIDVTEDIEKLAEELFKEETDLFRAVYKTAKWVEENVNYTMNIQTEKKVQKSSWVLENKVGVCDELTNLFISLLRSRGVRAKFISGVVYSQKSKKFENHGWAEVYFEGYGWIPFDITYSQYGWADITHIKLSESEDSGMSSVDYRWRSSDLELKVEELDIKADFKDFGDEPLSVLKASMEPARQKVGFGSYLPLKITIENPTSFYLIPMVQLTKSPSLESKNRRTILLEPNSIRSIYFLIKIPSRLDEDYIFRSELEADLSFGEKTSSMVEMSSDYPVITQEEAESIISKYTEKESKKEFTGVSFGCATERQVYYEQESMDIVCVIKNNEDSTKEANVCLSDYCKQVLLQGQEEKSVSFKAKSSSRVILTAEDKERIKYSMVNIEIIKIPDIIVKSIEPLVVDYNEEVNMKFEFETAVPAYNTVIYLGEQEILNTDIIEGSKQLSIKVKGKDLIRDIRLKMIYQDKLSKQYEKTEKYLVTIKNKPWYISLISWLL